MHGIDIIDRRHAARADGPYRFVGYRQLGSSILAAGQRAIELAGDDGHCRPGIALRFGFSDADDHAEARLLSSFCLGTHNVVAFTVHGATLTVTDDSEVGARIEQHRRGNIARIGAARRRVAILTADADVLNSLAHGVHKSERRRQGDLHAGKARGGAIDSPRLGQHRARAVHFPVADYVGKSCHYNTSVLDRIPFRERPT